LTAAFIEAPEDHCRRAIAARYCQADIERTGGFPASPARYLPCSWVTRRCAAKRREIRPSLDRRLLAEALRLVRVVGQPADYRKKLLSRLFDESGEGGVIAALRPLDDVALGRGGVPTV